MVVDGQEDAAPAQQPAAMGQQQCDLESGPGLSADEEVQRSEQQRRGEEVSVAGQPADQEQLPSIPCRQQQQSEGDEPAGGGAAPAAAPAGAGDDAAAGVTAEEGSLGRSAAQQRQLAPGEVGWFQVKGYPHWPFLVITREEAAARGLPGQQAGSGPRGRPPRQPPRGAPLPWPSLLSSPPGRPPTPSTRIVCRLLRLCAAR